MLSRAAKSIVQNLNHRSFHVSKGNLKTVALSRRAAKIRSVPHFLKSSKLNLSAFRDFTDLPIKNINFNNLQPALLNQKTLKPSADNQILDGKNVKGGAPDFKLPQAVDRRIPEDPFKTGLTNHSERILLMTFKLAAESFTALGENLHLILFQCFRRGYDLFGLPVDKKQKTKSLLWWENDSQRDFCAKKETDRVEELKIKMKQMLERIAKKLEELKQLKEKHPDMWKLNRGGAKKEEKKDIEKEKIKAKDTGTKEKPKADKTDNKEGKKKEIKAKDAEKKEKLKDANKNGKKGRKKFKAKDDGKKEKLKDEKKVDNKEKKIVEMKTEKEGKKKVAKEKNKSKTET